MKIQMPQAVHFLIERLEREGCEAYAVGGCIRDRLLGREPKDWDVCTSAHPLRVLEIFSDLPVIPTGIKHGTLTVIVEGRPYEVTTFRKDGDYQDGRRPASVDFVDALEEDLARRDFRINAIAYNEKRGLQDPFGGREDIEKKLLRTVGSPRLRFSEDYLRMIRAVRFAAGLNFEPEEEMMGQIRELAPKIRKISAERIRQELLRMLDSPHSLRAIRLLEGSGLLRQILPELSACIGVEQNHPLHGKDVYEHTLEVLENLGEAPVLLKLAALFHDIGKPKTKSSDEKGIDHFYAHEQVGAQMSREILSRLRFSNDEIELVTSLVLHHAYHPEGRRAAVKRFIRKVGKDRLGFLLELQSADIRTRSGREDALRQQESLGAMIEDIFSAEEPMAMGDLALSGKDLLAMGYVQGKEIGRIKESLMQHVLEHPEDNEKEILGRIVRERF